MANNQSHYVPPERNIPFMIETNHQDTLSSSLSSSPPLSQYKCHGLWYTVVLSIPAVLLVLYLGFHLRKSIRKLRHRRSHVMITYYILLWFSATLNLAWCSLQPSRTPQGAPQTAFLNHAGNLAAASCSPAAATQPSPVTDRGLQIKMWQCTPGKELSWNLLSLLTALGTLFLEISLVAFLLQESYASGLEALTSTFIISGLIVGADVLLKAICVFGFYVPLFMDGETTHRGKWVVWTVDELLLTCTYGYILFVHYSTWRDKLPPRPAFYNYVVVMFVITGIALFGCGLAAIGVGLGLWMYNLIVICYHALYLPFVYITFLVDFFQEEDLILDNAYYSEMKDAGFFDSDLE